MSFSSCATSIFSALNLLINKIKIINISFFLPTGKGENPFRSHKKPQRHAFAIRFKCLCGFPSSGQVQTIDFFECNIKDKIFKFFVVSRFVQIFINGTPAF